MTSPLTPSTTMMCLTCGKNCSPIGYARASDVQVYTPQYHQLEQSVLIAAYQRDQITHVRRLLDYHKVLDWARTTPRLLVGSAQRKEGHPLRRYLNDVDPTTTGRARWEIFPSACDALKRFPNVPHTRNTTVFECFHVQSTGVTFTIYCPLPSWTRGVMARLQDLPFGQPITREQLVSMLRTYT